MLELRLLFTRHQAEVDQLRAAVADALPEEYRTAPQPMLSAVSAEATQPFDDLFLLRFVMSNGSVLKAIGPLRKTIVWRSKNEEILRSIRTERSSTLMHPKLGPLLRKTQAEFASRDGGLVSVIFAANVDMREIMAATTYEELSWLMLIERERVFYRNDAATRATGRLIKHIVINDLRGANFWVSTERSFFRAIGHSSQQSEIYYPQLLGRFCLLSPPKWLSIAMSIALLFASKKTAAKVAVCRAHSNERQPGAMSKCPFASRFINPESLPRALGGTAGDGPWIYLPNDHPRLYSPLPVGATAATLAAYKDAPPTATVEPHSVVAEPTLPSASEGTGENIVI